MKFAIWLNRWYALLLVAGGFIVLLTFLSLNMQPTRAVRLQAVEEQVLQVQEELNKLATEKELADETE